MSSNKFIIWRKKNEYRCYMNNCDIKHNIKLTNYLKNNLHKIYYEKIIENHEQQIINEPNHQIFLQYLTNDMILEFRIPSNNNSDTTLQILSAISYKIRTPLTNILGIIADDTHLNYDVKYMKILKKSCYEILGTVNDIIDVVNFNRKELKLNLEIINITKLLSDCKEIVSAELKEKKLSLKINVGNNVPTTITTDIVKLKQIIICLLNNSIEYTNIGGINIDVGQFKNDKKSPTSNSLLFSIKDTGIGIDEPIKKHIESILEMDQKK